jgi:nitric oxide reductase subunit B
MVGLQYRSQRSAAPFFVTMVLLFLLQVAWGMTLALQQLDPFFLQGSLNFNVARALHLNLAVVWIVTGLAGTLIFAGPVIAGRDLAPRWLPPALLAAIWGIVLWTALTLPLSQRGIAGWFLGQPWLQEGLEYLEAGRVSDLLLLVGFAALTFLVLRVFPAPRRWNELHWALAIGLAGLATMWLFGLFFVSTLDLQEYFRWYVVHYWVEGVWEILAVALVGFLLHALFGADLRIIRYAVFWGVALVVLSGFLGNAHHYFWIGTPAYWQFWGSLFSSLEPLPMLFAVWHVHLDIDKTGARRPNTIAFYFIFGSVLLELVGAGILGFTQTFALTNLWEHGTWVTPAHAHLALFGTFGLLVFGGAYAAMPAIRGLDRLSERLSKLAFWLVFAGVLGMTAVFGFGGTVEVYVYRILGLDWFGGEIRPALRTSHALLAVFGFLFAVGAGALAYDLLTIRLRAGSPAEQPAGRWWRQPLSLFELGVWLGALWFFGLLITGGLLSFNLPSVRLGNPALPYLLATIGYPGLLLATLLFALRFLRAFEGQQAMASAVRREFEASGARA